MDPDRGRTISSGRSSRPSHAHPQAPVQPLDYGEDVAGERTLDEPGTERTLSLELARRLAAEWAGVATVSIADIDGGISVTITSANLRRGW